MNLGILWFIFLKRYKFIKIFKKNPQLRNIAEWLIYKFYARIQILISFPNKNLFLLELSAFQIFWYTINGNIKWMTQLRAD